MTGDLISHYEEIARELGEDPSTPAMDSMADGLLAIVRRMERSLDPDGACLTEMADALETFAEIASDDDVKAIRVGVKRAIPICESPIEKLMLPWLLAQPYEGFNYRPRLLLPGEGHLLEDKCVAVVPQLSIGNKRVDFALIAKRGVYTKIVVVEADGAAFHTSVEQIRRDAERDAGILERSSVLSIARFSGSEIYRSPRFSAFEAANELHHCWLKSTRSTADKFTVAA